MTRIGRPPIVEGERRRAVGLSLGEREIRALQKLSHVRGEAQGAIVGRLVLAALEEEDGKTPPLTDTFGAQVQYRDWSGEVEADNGDFDSNIREELRARELIGDDEFVVAIRGTNSENTRIEGLAPVYVTALIVPAAAYDDAQKYVYEQAPLRVRQVHFEMKLDEWARLFKRFSVAIASRGFESIIGREYEVVD
jgi:hypothetical protein